MDEGAGSWTAPEASPGASGRPPAATELLSRTSSIVMADPAQWLVAGLAPMVLGVVAGLGGVIVVYALMFGGLAVGMQAGDEDLAVLLAATGGMGGFFLLFAVITLASVPMTASLYRAVWAHLVRGEKLTIASAWSTAGQDVGRVLVYNLLAGTAILFGALFCYLPGLVIAALLVFAGPAIYIHRLGIGEAVSLSVRHAQAEPGFHVAFFGLGFVILLVLSYVPIIGPMLLATVYPLFVLLAYREIFGDGEAPRV